MFVLMLFKLLLMHEVLIDMSVEIWLLLRLMLFKLMLMHEVFVDMLAEI